MDDPVPALESNEDETKLITDKEEDNSSNKGQTTTEAGNGTEMGSQTQPSLNGGTDVVMSDTGETQKGSEDHKSPAGEEKEEEEKKVDGDGAKSSEDKEGEAAEAPAPAAPSAPPPPVLKGTLSYNTDLKRHVIRGMWNYENANDAPSKLPAQRFELLRNLGPEEDVTELPKDGEFHGSFSLAYFHTTSKGKQKERSKVITESGVNIKFTKIEGEEGKFKVDGKGTNQFGIFHINGTAEPTGHGDDQYSITLRKRYEPSSQAVAPVDSDVGKKSKKRKMANISGGNDPADNDEGPLPPPSQSYERNVVCLRGKVYKEDSEELGGIGEIVHRIHGMWSSGLDLILADPQNIRGLCNRFEYEHKSSVPSHAFPVSGRYTGWFDLNVEDGRQKINEKDVTLRFRKNSAGYHNVEGKGSNVFGKYTITGTLTQDNVITIFRHFQPKKIKASRPVTSAPPPINTPGQARRPSLPVAPEPKLKFDEVQVPEDDNSLEALNPPDNGTYSAVARGVLRLNEDGSHSCQGKWAVTREHLINGQTSNFTFRLEAHFAAEATKVSGGRQFPLDSHMYKGSFQLKKGGTRYQTIIDQQIVMKFRKNNTGAYNVYGKGINGIGVFNLTGTLIMSGKAGGQVEVYRMYPPELLAAPAPAKTASKSSVSKARPDTLPGSELPPTTLSIGTSSSTMLPGPPRAGVRRESSRLVKVPSRLEDDDPQAQLSRLMDKCNIILRFIREKDVERGAFFSEPVDPVALGIPTYHQVISEPMDLRTLHRKMEAGEVTSPEEFARLARLVFENAMTFNVDPTHSVHQAARNLLILFNQKYRDVERTVANLRRTQKDGDEKRKKKDDKKRKREREEPKSLRRRRLEEAQGMAAANANAMAAIVAAVPNESPTASVTRNEFNLVLQMMTQLQQQIVQTYTVLAETMSDEIESGSASSIREISSASMLPPLVHEKKAVKRKADALKPVERPSIVEDDSRPLTLQEQETLTETINDLPAEHLHGVIQIIREAAKLTGEEDEIDLEIDQLDTATQRKLLRHVSKFVKQPKRQKAKNSRKTKSAPASRRTGRPAPAPRRSAKTPPKKNPDSFFAFGNNEDSGTDSEGEISSPIRAPASEAAEEQFNLGDDADDSDEEEDGNGVASEKWNISKPTNESKSSGGDEDEGWGAALKAAEASKAREEDKKKREERMQADAEQLKNSRLADAVARGEEIRAKRQAEEEEEAREKKIRQEQEKEAVKKAREAARAKAKEVEQTVDLDAQRDMMKEFEQKFLDKEMGGASPSSDFGF